MDSPPGFPLFPKLASELRLRIVNDSIPLLIPIFKSSSLEHVPHRSREAGLTERFQWKYAFPVLSTPSEEIIVIIDRNIHFLATPPSTFPTQIVFNYDLSATFAPRAPPPINREVNYEFQRRYRVVLDLLPDIHSPVPAPPSLYALFNILQSPPSLSILARFVGFDQILRLSTPLEQPVMNGLRFLTRWLFTGLPLTCNDSRSSGALTNPNAALTSQTRSITTDLTYDSPSDMLHARRQALAVSPPVRSGDTESAQNLLRTTRVILVHGPIDENLDVEIMGLFGEREEKLGEEGLLEQSEYSLLRKRLLIWWMA
ncbi:hypothetical protein IFR04_015843 [Cadophora malorum]|uniref:Uncharacterized protein n=1 Tax=Cadophora malorum TaxID=108018 RepID=A0A8H7VZ32_9HELO|nr:hypothetical protein IFR04_015843 [Cadophora malorum]